MKKWPIVVCSSVISAKLGAEGKRVFAFGPVASLAA